MADNPELPTKSGGPSPREQPQARTNEPSLTGPEQAPVYTNLIRDFSPLPRPPQGGNWVFVP